MHYHSCERFVSSYPIFCTYRGGDCKRNDFNGGSYRFGGWIWRSGIFDTYSNFNAITDSSPADRDCNTSSSNRNPGSSNSFVHKYSHATADFSRKPNPNRHSHRG